MDLASLDLMLHTSIQIDVERERYGIWNSQLAIDWAIPPRITGDGLLGFLFDEEGGVFLDR